MNDTKTLQKQHAALARQLVKAVVLVVILLSLLCALGSVLITGYTLAAAPDPEAEYYRAIYDICVAQTRQPEMCLQATANFKAKGWYEQESPGWGDLPAPRPAQPVPARPGRGLPNS